MTTIGIFGAAGRMGRAIAQVAADADLGIAGGTDRDGVGEIAPGIAITTDPLALAERSDVLIDFPYRAPSLFISMSALPPTSRS